MKNIVKKLIIWSGIRVWGVRIESVASEFVITKHGEARLKERLPMYDPEQIVFTAWYKGKKPSKWFAPKSDYSLADRFHNYQYKEYKGVVYVYGVIWKKEYSEYQKHLVTLYLKQ